MVRHALKGLLAGAAGTVTLDIATYADMALRDRSSSNGPSKMVSTIANRIHLPLSSQGVGVQDQTAQNRQSGLGALLGYGTGLGTGVVYSVLRSQRDDEIPPILGFSHLSRRMSLLETFSLSLAASGADQGFSEFF